MKPRKFVYCEKSYFGSTYLVEWREGALEVQSSTACIPFLVEPECRLHPTNSDWDNFVNSVESLKIGNEDYDKYMCDGFEVECHITFYRCLFNFSLINPNTADFEKLRVAINSLTKSNEFPDGVFGNEESEE